MGSIDITIDKELIGDIQRIADKLPSAVTEFLDDIASSLEVLMKDEAPVRLGDLQNSITTDTVSPLERLIWPSMFYAPFVILGTRRHPINSPVNIEGNWVYIKEHPGTSPNPFPDRALDRADSII
jgi:hypothetical protein